MRLFVSLSIFFLIVFVACESVSSTQTGTLKQPIVTINPDSGEKFGGGAASKLRDIKTDLPFELWDSYEIKQFSVSRGSWAR